MGLRSSFVSPEDRGANGVQPETSYLDSLKASIGLGFSEGMTSSAARLITAHQKAKEGEMLSPEQAVNEYQLGIVPEEDTSRGQLEWMQENYKTKLRKEKIIKYGPKGFFGQAVVPFAGRMIGNMADPTELAIGFALGAGTGFLLKAGKAGTAAYRASRGASKLAKFGIAAGENAIASGISAAFEVTASKEAGIEYTAEEAFKNVVFSSIAFTGAFHGGSALIGKLRKLGEPALSNVARYMEDSGANGIKGNMGAIERAVEKLSVDEATTTLVKKNFPGTIGDELLEGVELKKEIGINLQKKIEAGDLTEVDANVFLQAVDEAGLDRKMFDPELNNVYMDEIDRKALMEGAESIAPEVPVKTDEVIPKKFSEMETKMDEVIQRRDEKIKNNLYDEDSLAEIKRVQKEVEPALKKMDIEEAMAKCIGG